jgi:hypothetical protein
LCSFLNSLDAPEASNVAVRILCHREENLRDRGQRPGRTEEKTFFLCPSYSGLLGDIK